MERRNGLNSGSGSQQHQYTSGGLGYPQQGQSYPQATYPQYEPATSAYQQPGQQQVLYETISPPGTFAPVGQSAGFSAPQFSYQAAAAPQAYRSVSASPYQSGSYATQAASVPSLQSQLQAHLQQQHQQQYQAQALPQYSQAVPLSSGTAAQLQAAYAYQQQQARLGMPQQPPVGYQPAYDQARLLLDLYRNRPSAQAQPLSQAVASQQPYTPEQHFNFLVQQHYDVMKAQQDQQDNIGNFFSPTEVPISTTISPPASATTPAGVNPTPSSASGLGTRYSPSTGVSNVNFSSANLKYNF